MNVRDRMRKYQRGVGLIEVMISIVIGMLMVLVIYQIYEVSEGQKRTITAGSDAMQNASYGLYALGRDLSMAGNGIASSASTLIACPFDPVNPGQSVFPIPVVIQTGATANDPDRLTAFYGGSSTLSTPAKFTAASAGSTYQVAGPVAFSQYDVIVAVQGPSCSSWTLSTINAGGVAVNAANGFATITHTAFAPAAGIGAPYSAATASLVNLGKSTCPNPPGQQATVGRIQYTVDPAAHALRTQNLMGIVCGAVDVPASLPISPIVSEVANLKAQYGLATVPPGGNITWQDSNGTWLADLLAIDATTPIGQAQRLTQLRRLIAVRIALVTRSAQYDKDEVAPMCGPPLPARCLQMFDNTVTMNLTLNDDPHYRYKVLETIVPMRNALWNVP